MFLMPALILWILLYFGETFWQKCRILAVCVAIFAAGVFLNQLLTKIYGAGENLTGSNFSYSLCGLSIGADWSACPQKYADEVKKLPPNEKAQADFFLSKALSNIRKDPDDHAATTSLRWSGVYANYFVISDPGVFAPNPVNHLQSDYLCYRCNVRAGNRRTTVLELPRSSILATCLCQHCGVIDVCLLRRRPSRYERKLSANCPTLDRGLQQPQENSDAPTERKLLLIGGLIAAGVAICFLGSPALAFKFMHTPPSLSSGMPTSDHQYIYGGRQMSGFVIVADNEQPLKDAPSMTLGNFKKVVKTSGIEFYQGLVVDNEPPPTPFAFIYAARAEPNAQNVVSYIVPSDVFLNKAVPIWRLTVREWHKRPNFGSYWFLATRGDPVSTGQ